MQLRPSVTFKMPTKVSIDDEEYRFGLAPLIVDLNYIDTSDAIEYETDEEDMELCIQSSWYYRARLGDENRILYNDYQDIDWELEEAKREHRHSLETSDSDDEYELNTKCAEFGFKV